MMTTALGWAKLIGALLVAAFLVFIFFQHKHDTNTIAGQKQLLAQADTQKDLDAATIAQLRSDITAQSTLVAQLTDKTVVAMKAANDAQVTAAKASAPVQAEITHLKAKAAAPVAASQTCETAINEWRARQ